MRNRRNEATSEYHGNPSTSLPMIRPAGSHASVHEQGNSFFNEATTAGPSTSLAAGYGTLLIPGLRTPMPEPSKYDEIVLFHKTDLNPQDAERHAKKLAMWILNRRLRLVSLATQLGTDRQGHFNNLKGHSNLHEDFKIAKKEFLQIYAMAIEEDERAKGEPRQPHGFAEWSHEKRVPKGMTRLISAVNRLRGGAQTDLTEGMGLDDFDPRSLAHHTADLHEKMKYAYQNLDIGFRYPSVPLHQAQTPVQGLEGHPPSSSASGTGGYAPSSNPYIIIQSFSP